MREEELEKEYEKARAFKEALNFLAHIGGRKVELFKWRRIKRDMGWNTSFVKFSTRKFKIKWGDRKTMSILQFKIKNMEKYQ